MSKRGNDIQDRRDGLEKVRIGESEIRSDFSEAASNFASAQQISTAQALTLPRYSAPT